MALITFVFVMAIWAYRLLRDRPLQPYGKTYFIGGLMGFVSEFMASGFFDFYHLRVHILPEKFADVRLAAFFDKLGAIPLVAVVYACYCCRRPVLAALVGGAALGVVEVIFLWTGGIEYRWWSPLLTAPIFVLFFLLVWVIHTERFPVPTWLHVDAFAFWVAFLLDVLFSGAFGLWFYRTGLMPDPEKSSRVFSLLINGFLVAPLATWVALRPSRSPGTDALWAATAITVLEGVAWWFGWIEYAGWWNLAASAIRNSVIMVAPIIYVQWLGQHEPLPS